MKAICTECGKYNGPNIPVNADYQGWICPKCYKKLQEIPLNDLPDKITADRITGFDEWWSGIRPLDAEISDADLPRLAWNAALAAHPYPDPDGWIATSERIDWKRIERIAAEPVEHCGGSCMVCVAAQAAREILKFQPTPPVREQP